MFTLNRHVQICMACCSLVREQVYYNSSSGVSVWSFLAIRRTPLVLTTAALQTPPTCWTDGLLSVLWQAPHPSRCLSQQLVKLHVDVMSSHALSLCVVCVACVLCWHASGGAQSCSSGSDKSWRGVQTSSPVHHSDCNQIRLDQLDRFHQFQTLPPDQCMAMHYDTYRYFLFHFYYQPSKPSRNVLIILALSIIIIIVCTVAGIARSSVVCLTCTVYSQKSEKAHKTKIGVNVSQAKSS